MCCWQQVFRSPWATRTTAMNVTAKFHLADNVHSFWSVIFKNCLPKTYAMQHGHIPDAPNLSVENLPRILYLHDGEFFFA